jgi:hypothetical protein
MPFPNTLMLKLSRKRFFKMDNSIQVYLLNMKRQIEARNKTSDNKAYAIKTEKLEVVKFLITSKRIQETEKLAALKIVGIKKLND